MSIGTNIVSEKGGRAGRSQRKLKRADTHRVRKQRASYCLLTEEKIRGESECQKAQRSDHASAGEDCSV